MEVKENSNGILKRISGPVVTAVGLNAHMYDVVQVGDEKLMGEVIRIEEDRTIIRSTRIPPVSDRENLSRTPASLWQLSSDRAF